MSEDSGFFGSIASGWNKLKESVVGPTQSAVDTVVPAGSVATTPGATSALGTAPEAPNTNVVGGRRKKRHNKTRRNKKSKKTMKRKH